MASIFGISDESFKKSQGKTFSDVIEDWSNKAIEELRRSLQDKVRLATSKKLEQSIIALPISFQGNQLTVSIQAEAYANFLNEGVKGVGGEMKDGTKWNIKSPGSPFAFKQNTKPSAKHFVQWSYLAGRSPFAVRETVWRSGIKANHFIDDVINGDFEKMFAEGIEQALARTIEVDIKTDFDGK